MSYHPKTLNSCSLVTIFRRSLSELNFQILNLFYFFFNILSQTLEIPGSCMTHTVLFIMNSFSPKEKVIQLHSSLMGNGLITQPG